MAFPHEIGAPSRAGAEQAERDRRLRRGEPGVRSDLTWGGGGGKRRGGARRVRPAGALGEPRAPEQVAVWSTSWDRPPCAARVETAQRRGPRP